MLENNEMITKAKMEYYENELAKKEQEILNLLDVKKSDELRSPDSKSDLETVNIKDISSNKLAGLTTFMLFLDKFEA